MSDIPANEKRRLHPYVCHLCHRKWLSGEPLTECPECEYPITEEPPVEITSVTSRLEAEIREFQAREVALEKQVAEFERILAVFEVERTDLYSRIHYLETEDRGSRAASSVPCALCDGPVHEFTVDNDVWNRIIRRDGNEHDEEYLCVNCFGVKALEEIRILEAAVTGKRR